MEKRKTKNYGWHRDLPDQRDLMYSPTPQTVAAPLPAHVDLRSQMPSVYDQGQLGSCTANAICGAMEFNLMRQKSDMMLSRLFEYYGERAIEGTTSTDSGAQIRDGIKTVNQQGVCPESEWPYHITRFAIKPPKSCYTAALKYKVTSYLSVKQTETDVKSCLVEGDPVVVGFSVYESFESDLVAKTGIVPMPSPGESMIGGHCVLVVGYDDESQRWICRNSWGASWGQQGYFTIPYAYLTNPKLASDFWTIRVVA